MCVNIYKLWVDKHVAGVHWGSTFFFSAWGMWNLYFYPANGLWYSFLGGSFLVWTNLVWLEMVMYYRRRKSVRPRTVVIPKKRIVRERINT